jgi:hypothetical protein
MPVYKGDDEYTYWHVYTQLRSDPLLLPLQINIMCVACGCKSLWRWLLICFTSSSKWTYPASAAHLVNYAACHTTLPAARPCPTPPCCCHIPHSQPRTMPIGATATCLGLPPAFLPLDPLHGERSDGGNCCGAGYRDWGGYMSCVEPRIPTATKGSPPASQ